MNQRKRGFLLLCAVTLWVTTGGAEQNTVPPSPSEKAPSLGFAFQLGLGTETLPIDATAPIGADNQTTYQKLLLQPELSYGKLGVGFDLAIHFNLRPGSSLGPVDIYEADWIPDKAGKTVLELYLPKFAYIRWGHKGDPLFAKLGSFDDGTLGDGFIMGNYSNTQFLPATRIFGGALDVDGALFNFPYIGIETFVSNVAHFDVIGSRLYGRPLAAQTNPLLQKLQAGFTVAGDTDPLRYAGTADRAAIGSAEPVTVYGADLRLPILEGVPVSLAAFSDAAFERQGRWGTMAGLGGRFIGLILYGAQLRLLGPDFIPTYFDASYDLFRVEKYRMISGDPSGDPYVGYLASLGFSLLSDTLVFQTSLDGPFKAPSGGPNPKITDYPHLRSTITVAEGILSGFSFDGLYEKYFLGAETPYGRGNFWADLVSPESAVIGAKINYHTGAVIISLLYNLRYDPTSKNYIITSGLLSTVRF